MNSEKKDDKTLTVLQSKLTMFQIMCNYLLHNVFLENAKNLGQSNEAKRSKTGKSLRGQKNYATPTNEDLGQTSNWSKLVAAYLPLARLTILDRLVSLSKCHGLK